MVMLFLQNFSILQFVIHFPSNLSTYFTIIKNSKLKFHIRLYQLQFQPTNMNKSMNQEYNLLNIVPGRPHTTKPPFKANTLGAYDRQTKSELSNWKIGSSKRIEAFVRVRDVFM